MEAAIEIAGLAEFARAVRRVDAEAAKGLRLALNKAAQVVVDYGTVRMPRRTGRAASTIKARSTRTSVRVVEGGRRAPYTAWLDFGGRTGRRKSVVRTFYKEGRYLYPALTDERERIQSAIDEGLQAIADATGLELD